MKEGHNKRTEGYKWNRGEIGKQRTKKSKEFCQELMSVFPSKDTNRIVKDASNNSYIVVRVFAVAGKVLPSRCLLTIRGINTQPHRQQGDFTSVCLFVQNKESGLKRGMKEKDKRF
jgi:hypothetical protein